MSGHDDGMAGNIEIADLDMDGWIDVLICDADIDLAGCSRRLHIYHNPGGAPGSEIDLWEEREKPNAGLLGVAGMVRADLGARPTSACSTWTVTETSTSS